MDEQEKTTSEDTPRVLKLDTEDILRLENMMLRSQSAKMSVRLMEIQVKEQQNAFQSHIVSKFDIDISKFQLQVNPTDNTITIVPR